MFICSILEYFGIRNSKVPVYDPLYFFYDDCRSRSATIFFKLKESSITKPSNVLGKFHTFNYTWVNVITNINQNFSTIGVTHVCRVRCSHQNKIVFQEMWILFHGPRLFGKNLVTWVNAFVKPELALGTSYGQNTSGAFYELPLIAWRESRNT